MSLSDKGIDNTKAEPVAFKNEEKANGNCIRTDSNSDQQVTLKEQDTEDKVKPNGVVIGTERNYNLQDHVYHQNGCVRTKAIETKENSTKDVEFERLREEIRAKRVALRKLHAKLKIDLNGMQKMKDLLDANDRTASANLPQVVTASGRSYTDDDFLKDFRQLFQESTNDLTESTRDLENFTKKHTEIVEKSHQHRDNNDASSQLEGESQRLVSDSEKMLTMLHKAMKIAILEHRLKIIFSENTTSPESQVSKLESALLDLLRLKSTLGLGFDMENKSANISASYCSARDVFTQLFPQEKILKLEKKSKIKLAELHIDALENRQKHDEAQHLLQDAIKENSTTKLQDAIDHAIEIKMDPNNDILLHAKSIVSSLVRESKQNNKVQKESSHSNSFGKPKKILHKADPPTTSPPETPIETKPVAPVGKESLKRLLSELQIAVKKKELEKTQQLLVDITSIKVLSTDKIIDDAYKMLTRMKHDGKDSNSDATETIRAGLLSSLESNNSKVIAEMLVRAQLIGLKNCIEIMGAKAKLAQLQHNDVMISSEMKKIEDYMDKLSIKAIDNKATVDMIMTLERAIAVGDRLNISASVKQKAKGALHVLQARKQKVKSVKDELQRAVMECRHEAITCAIKEAESLPYFRDFDPFDGQIAAILDYAKHKISPHENPTESGQQNPAERRVKSNLKRAMKGNSSSKLESAISLFRKTYNITDAVESSNKRVHYAGNDDTKTLVRRAERKCRRMKKQEKMEEKALITIRNDLRESLKSAMNENDRAELWKAVYQFKRELGSNLESDDDKLLSDAKKQLRHVTIQQCKSNLTSALKDRDANRLRHSLIELESPSLSGYNIENDNQLKDDMEKATKLLSHLTEMERLKKSVAEMNRSQLAELHRYPNPPSCVRAVMRATYILLGETEKDLKDWPAVMRLLVKMGRESLIRRVAICPTSSIPASSAYQAQEILSVLTQIQVQDVNRTAAIFYGWAKCVITEVLDCTQHDPAREEQFKRRPVAKPKPKGPSNDPVKSEFWNRLSRPRSSTTARPVRNIRNPPRPISATT